MTTVACCFAFARATEGIIRRTVNMKFNETHHIEIQVQKIHSSHNGRMLGIGPAGTTLVGLIWETLC